MNIEEFRAELETRLNIEKEYILQELSSVVDEREKLVVLLVEVLSPPPPPQPVWNIAKVVKINSRFIVFYLIL